MSTGAWDSDDYASLWWEIQHELFPEVQPRTKMTREQIAVVQKIFDAEFTRREAERGR